MRPIPEKQLYPVVQRWMIRSFKCFKAMHNVGLNYSRCDVVGVRDVGGQLSGEIETICIEVKIHDEPFATASGQALGYRVYGNRVYLAYRRPKPFTDDQIAIASTLGIGLIWIRDIRCQEVLSSPFYRPLTRLNLRLLERMALGHCQICGSYFDIGNAESGGNRWANLALENVKKAIDDEKGIVFWNWEVGQRKKRLKIDLKRRDRVFESRFICADCVSRLLSKVAQFAGKG